MKGGYLMKTMEEIRNIIKREGIQYIRLQFTDVLGAFKNIELPISQLEKVVDNEVMFDSSSIAGFTTIFDSDMMLYPDWSTFAVIPKIMDDEGVVRVICDVVRPDGTPFVGDPRSRLKKIAEKAKGMGYSNVYAGPEPEFFFLSKDNIEGDRGGYFDLSPSDEGEGVRREIVKTLQSFGFVVEALHHEVSEGQHEIDWKYGDLVTTADRIQTFKWVVKTIAKKHGQEATFMPKPFFGRNGSGMHVHLSLGNDGSNAFYDEQGELNLSREAYQFLTGILEFSKYNALFTNPTVNSYKRLVPGYEAPVYIAWSPSNRSCLIRIPASRGMGTRVEVRNPDPSCNPYLALTVLVGAGLTGISSQLTHPEKKQENLFELTEKERVERGIETLPGSLGEAIVVASSAKEYFGELLGSHIFENYINLKTKEWDRYRLAVTDWELKEYI